MPAPMTTIGPLIVVDGQLSTEGDLTIEGSVTGFVSVPNATLTIESSAQVDADVRAARVVIRGRCRGAIAATERIELTASASVEGSLSAERVMIAEGARFNGDVDMNRRTIASRVAEYRASHAPEGSGATP